MGTVGFARTGRQCEKVGCRGALVDGVLDWDSALPVKELRKAERHTKSANLVICLGTSLRIRPAGNMPLMCVRRNGKRRAGRLVIVNLQNTHLDKKCTLRMFARCDSVMKGLMDALGIAIDEFKTKEAKAAKAAKRKVNATSARAAAKGARSSVRLRNKRCKVETSS